MNRIIISTDFVRLNFLESQYEKQLDLLEVNPIIGFSPISKEFTTDYSGCDIILIKDTLKVNELNSLKLNKSNDYFLHHENENGLKQDQERLFNDDHILKGNHIANNNYVYYPLFTEIIFVDTIENKVEEIVNRFFKVKFNEAERRIKIKLLEYVYNGNKPDSYHIPDSVKDVEDVNDLIEYFKNHPYKKDENGSGLNDEQNKKYVQLRILLGFKS